MQVLVRDNNVDQALKVLKKRMQREGIFREMKLRRHYEKPSEKKTREKAEAIRRARKLARKKMQRDGLLPMKPRVVPGALEKRLPRARPPSLIEASEFQRFASTVSEPPYARAAQLAQGFEWGGRPCSRCNEGTYRRRLVERSGFDFRRC